jgi:putative transposase
MMDREVDHLAGPRGQRQTDRSLSRWGVAKGYCVVNGQKVPLRRPRIRNAQHHEQPLGSYQMIQQSSLFAETVWQRMMRGLSTRGYSQVVREFTDSYGLEKSTVDEHFIECSRQKMQQLLERPLSGFRICAVFLDGTCYRDQNLLVAMGLTCEGYKIALGLRQVSTENATVVKELLSDLTRHGLDFSVPRLYVLDGSKGLSADVRAVAG